MKTKIEKFLSQPFPLWETDLTADLVNDKFLSGINEGWIQPHFGYTTVNAYYKQDKGEYSNRKKILSKAGYKIFLEEPSNELLGAFYQEHGLTVQTSAQLSENNYTSSINAAFDLMAGIPDCLESVANLVNTIQVLKSSDDEIDISYSHPDLPFSIFFSTSNDRSLVASCRVAESILHEAMHLKLTLIENIVPLVTEGSRMTFYSPWRDEPRPLRGVLHGMFVFTAIYDFYQDLIKTADLDHQAIKFITYRIEDIQKEVRSISLFPNCDGLTTAGQCLATMLLKHLSF